MDCDKCYVGQSQRLVSTGRDEHQRNINHDPKSPQIRVGGGAAIPFYYRFPMYCSSWITLSSTNVSILCTTLYQN